jgi:hypothetical protein
MSSSMHLENNSFEVGIRKFEVLGKTVVSVSVNATKEYLPQGEFILFMSEEQLVLFMSLLNNEHLKLIKESR